MKTPKETRKLIVLLISLLSLFFSIEADAALSSAGVLDTVLAKYASVASSWGTVLVARAVWLFWVLATISMVWTFGILALRKADLSEFFAEFIKFIVFTGFFLWLLTNGPKMATGIMDSFLTMGANASGSNIGSSPSQIVDIGFSIFFDTSAKSTPLDIPASIIGGAISLIILVILALVAINMLMLQISGWLLAFAGVFILGFGGSRWTSDMAITYFKTVLNIGLQLMMMVLLVNIGKTLLDQYYNNLAGGIRLKELGVMLVVSITLMILTNKIPPMIGSIAMGGGTHALGNGFGGGAALAAGGALGAAAAMGGAALKSGAANIAGGTQALMAAYQNASSEAGSGSGSGSPGFLSNTSSGTQSGPSTQGQASPLAKAMGITASTSANLARGVWDVAKNKAQNGIDNSLAGQVTQAVKNNAPTFGSDSLEGAEDNNKPDPKSAAI